MTVVLRRHGQGWLPLILLTLVLTGCGGESSLSDNSTNDPRGQQASQTNGAGNRYTEVGEPGEDPLQSQLVDANPTAEATPESAVENPIFADPIRVSEDADPNIRDPEITDPEPDPVADRPVLQWDSPMTRVDGSKLFPGEISGYRVYYRLRHQDDYQSLVVDGPGSTRLELDEFRSGAYEFSVTAIDNDGLESRHSEPVPVDII